MITIILSALGGAAVGIVLQARRTSRALGVPITAVLRSRGGAGEE